MWEIFDFGFTVNFVQAANPICGVFMIYKAMGTMAGKRLYRAFEKREEDSDQLIWDSLKYIFPMIMPQVIICVSLWINMVEIPQCLIEAGLYED